MGTREREHPLRAPDEMALLSKPPAAFLSAPVLRISQFHRHPLKCKHTHNKRCAVRRRVIASGNLYPDPEPPERIENPANSGGEEKVEKPEESLFDKLNRRMLKKQDVEVLAVAAEDDDKSELAKEAKERFTERFDNSSLPERAAPAKVTDYSRAARALWRIGWVTWWVQLILAVVSGIILLFSFAFPGVNVRSSASIFGFILAGIGVALAFISLFWTYSYTRLSIWLQEANRTVEQASSRISGRLRFGLVIAIIGLLVSLTGLQAIVGTLLARLLSAGIATTPYSSYPNAAAGVVPGTAVVQPVDVLVVQACANSMMALMAALTATVWLRSRQGKWKDQATP